jgi:hypothetical protein
MVIADRELAGERDRLVDVEDALGRGAIPGARSVNAEPAKEGCQTMECHPAYGAGVKQKTPPPGRTGRGRGIDRPVNTAY